MLGIPGSELSTAKSARAVSTTVLTTHPSTSTLPPRVMRTPAIPMRTLSITIPTIRVIKLNNLRYLRRTLNTNNNLFPQVTPIRTHMIPTILRPQGPLLTGPTRRMSLPRTTSRHLPHPCTTSPLSMLILQQRTISRILKSSSSACLITEQELLVDIPYHQGQDPTVRRPTAVKPWTDWIGSFFSSFLPDWRSLFLLNSPHGTQGHFGPTNRPSSLPSSGLFRPTYYT